MLTPFWDVTCRRKICNYMDMVSAKALSLYFGNNLTWLSLCIRYREHGHATSESRPCTDTMSSNPHPCTIHKWFQACFGIRFLKSYIVKCILHSAWHGLHIFFVSFWGWWASLILAHLSQRKQQSCSHLSNNLFMCEKSVRFVFFSVYWSSEVKFKMMQVSRARLQDTNECH